MSFQSDKRDVAQIFRERLGLLISRRDQSFSAFADAIGIDRSALSQFLAPGSTRLPRAETLHAISRIAGVSVDWLLGLIASETLDGTAVPMIEIAETNETIDSEIIAAWHREALGYKIRYVPSGLPDLLRIEAVAEHEFADRTADSIAARERQSREQLDYLRRPETDMEVCMPMQRLETFARGMGVWAGLSSEIRTLQLATIRRLTHEMYPTFRLFLYDGRHQHASPYTVFGPKRAAIYLGGLYLVVNSAEHIKGLTRNFDNLIRIAEVGPDRIADYVERLEALTGEVRPAENR
ncbi:MAG: transcriptional regulator [Nitratireductor sp.]|nr:transcriptional regulator [Nitratireductor sp.]